MKRPCRRNPQVKVEPDLAPVFPNNKITRRGFVRIASAGGLAALAGDSILIEPNRPEIVRQEMALRRWPAQLDGFTIALLSDFHYDPLFSVHPLQAAIPMVKGLRPDLIVLTGDFVSIPTLGSDREKAAAAADPCAQLLRQMAAPFGLWAVLGNHDDRTDPVYVTHVLRSAGIAVLANQSVPIETKGSRFWLAGVNDVLSRTADLNATLHKVPADEATVLLAHEPDYADHVARHPVDLQLSGHSHGGQVRFPLLPPLYLPPLARKYIAGLYRIGPLTLYTNRGLGTVGLAVRFNCPPEITLVTLRYAGTS
jgi:predicted MPP superfamily phosphohydrolase